MNERSQRAQWHQRKLKPNIKIGHLQPSESLPENLWLFFQFIFDIANFEIFKLFKIKILQRYDIIDLTKRKQNCCDCCAKFELSKLLSRDTSVMEKSPGTRNKSINNE